MHEQDAAGQQIGLRWLLHDITEWKRAEAALRFLVQAGQALTARVDYEVTLAAVARLALRSFADCCGVYLTGVDDPLRQLILAHADADTEVRLRELTRSRPPDPSAPIGVPKVLRTGKPERIAEVSTSFLNRHAEDAVHLGLLPDLGLRSYMVVPLRIRGRTRGAMTFCRKASRPAYVAEDLMVAEQVAWMAALTMENRRLYQDIKKRQRSGEAGLSQPTVSRTSRPESL
jgi:GAF domain-containing protein